jgi:glycerol-3-phosphate dehydrogenase
MAEKRVDVAVIGGGVIGCAVARELSRYELSVCLLEKCEDVCSGTSKANSAIVHAGYDAENGTLKAKLNVEGNRLMEQLSKDLDFEFRRNGSMVLCFSEEDRDALHSLYQRGVKNQVPELVLLSGDEARKLEPNLSDEVVEALFAPTGGIVCPFGLTIALAENAADNGVCFYRETEVTHMKKQKEGYKISTNKGEITAKCVVNAAGVYADEIHNMVSDRKIHIVPRKGDYCLLDREAGNLVDKTIFQLPGKYGKGILVSPTVHGNLLLGPTAVDIEDKEGTKTTSEELEDVEKKAALSVKHIPYRKVITSFSGLRAHESGGDFIIGECEDAEGFFDAAGIESPGLSSAPAIGLLLAEKIVKKLGAKEKKDFKNTRKGMVRPDRLSPEERARLIKEKPEYGTIVCRCENVTEGEMIEAVRRPVGAVSMDGIKRRTRAGMGRCQAGFCTPKTMEILSRELGIPMEEIKKNKKGSLLLTGGRLEDR